MLMFVLVLFGISVISVYFVDLSAGLPFVSIVDDSNYCTILT